MKRWKTIYKYQISKIPAKRDLALPDKYQIDTERILEILLDNRGIKTNKDVREFLNPKLENVTTKSVGINNKQLQKSINRIKSAIKNKEKIVVFGDYDVDGICGTAILWETLNSLGAKVMPYIPHRIEEGYGLSIKGIQNVILSRAKNLDPSATPQDDKTRLIITVDNGIVANKAVEFANKQGIDVIITDHHVPSKKLPKAFAIVHTTKLCGAGVAYLLAQETMKSCHPERSEGSHGASYSVSGDSSVASLLQNDRKESNHLELVALATVADLVPLIDANRTILAFGLQQLRITQRIGLKALFQEAGIEQDKLGVYEIGHVIAPRLNAMGRLDYAMDSLRLLCTNNKKRAEGLAQVLGSTNKERQTLTIETVEHAKSGIKNQELRIRKLLFIAHESYQQGVIGLVAGKLVEEFYRPAIVVSVGDKYSKASARSVSGFNIIEFIRGASELLVDAGGHPMAAGFTVETTKLSVLQKIFEERANELLDEEMLKRTLRIDCNLPLEFVSNDLYDVIQRLAPFGMGNPEPTFVSRAVVVEDMRVVGRENKHLKLQLVCHPEASAEGSNEILRSAQNDKRMIDGIAFGMGERASEFHIGDKVDVVYTIDEDRWDGNKKLQLKIKDITTERN